jgi:hypothetical protein
MPKDLRITDRIVHLPRTILIIREINEKENDPDEKVEITIQNLFTYDISKIFQRQENNRRING